MKKAVLALIAAALLAVSAAVSAIAADPVPVTGIRLSESAITLAPKRGLTIRATVEPADATNKNLAWSSSDESVAVVSKGKITTVGVGTAVITAAAEDGSGVSASLTVTVILAVQKITLSETKQFPLAPSVSWQITARVEPEDATVQKLNWMSTNQRVATVDENGRVTALETGTSTIRAVATDGSGTEAFVKVKVTRYDLVFKNARPQPVDYSITAGTHHVRGSVKTGCVSIPELDYTVEHTGLPVQRSVSVTPVRPGPDMVSITGGGYNYKYLVFVSPDAFPEPGEETARGEDKEPAEILFLDIPWGSSYPEAQALLEKQGEKIGPAVQRNDFVRAMMDEVPFADCMAANAALDFSREPEVTDFKTRNALFRGTFYFDPGTPVQEIRAAVRSVYGLDEGEPADGGYIWKLEDVTVTLARKERFTVLEVLRQKAE